MRPADVAHADQAQAAADHASDAVWRHTSALPGGGTARVGVTPPAWMVAAVAQHAAILAAGRGRACGHLAGSPVLYVMALWRPGWALCGPCASRPGNPLLAVDDQEDMTCDGCKGLFPDGLRVSVTQFGANGLLYFAMCRACLERWFGVDGP